MFANTLAPPTVLMVGATGATVSTLMFNTDDVVALPAASVEVAVKVFTPCARFVTFAVKCPVPSAVPEATTAPAAFFTTTALPASAATEIACVVLVAKPPVRVDVSVTNGEMGEVVSIFKVVVAVSVLPAASLSVDTTLTVSLPSNAPALAV